MREVAEGGVPWVRRGLGWSGWDRLGLIGVGLGWADRSLGWVGVRLDVVGWD